MAMCRGLGNARCDAAVSEQGDELVNDEPFGDASQVNAQLPGHKDRISANLKVLEPNVLSGCGQFSICRQPAALPCTAPQLDQRTNGRVESTVRSIVCCPRDTQHFQEFPVNAQFPADRRLIQA